jgi:SAM-dependent methyltransferase
VSDKRLQLSTTFDGDALLYDAVRPGYPEALFDDVVSLSGIPLRGRILEIGCGTGQATVPFARRGYRILCVELGENLAVVARRNLAAYPRVEVQSGDFEEWTLEAGTFDLAVSATAFHWLDPAVAYPKVARALRPGGAGPLLERARPKRRERGLLRAAQRVYEREAPEIVKPDDYKGRPQPHELPDRTAEIEASGLFDGVIRRDYRWDETYDAEGHLSILNTYSGHRSLNDASRERLFIGIRDLIEREHGGRIVKGYLTTLYFVRRR